MDIVPIGIVLQSGNAEAKLNALSQQMDALSDKTVQVNVNVKKTTEAISAGAKQAANDTEKVTASFRSQAVTVDSLTDKLAKLGYAYDKWKPFRDLPGASREAGNAMAQAGAAGAAGMNLLGSSLMKGRTGYLELMHTARATADILLMGGNSRMLLAQIPQALQGMSLAGISVTTVLGSIAPLIPAIGGAAAAWMVYKEHQEEAISATNAMTDALKRMPGILKEVNDAAMGGSLPSGYAQNLRSRLAGASQEDAVNPENRGWLSKLGTWWTTGSLNKSEREAAIAAEAAMKAAYANSSDGRLEQYEKEMVAIGRYREKIDPKTKKKTYEFNPAFQAVDTWDTMHSQIQGLGDVDQFAKQRSDTEQRFKQLESELKSKIDALTVAKTANETARTKALSDPSLDPGQLIKRTNVIADEREDIERKLAQAQSDLADLPQRKQGELNKIDRSEQSQADQLLQAQQGAKIAGLDREAAATQHLADVQQRLKTLNEQLAKIPEKNESARSDKQKEIAKAEQEQTEAKTAIVDAQIAKSHQSLELDLSKADNQGKINRLVEEEKRLKEQLASLNAKQPGTKSADAVQKELAGVTEAKQRLQEQESEKRARVQEQLAEAKVRLDQVGLTTGEQLARVQADIVRLKAIEADTSKSIQQREQATRDLLHQQVREAELLNQQRQEWMNSGSKSGIDARLTEQQKKIKENPFYNGHEEERKQQLQLAEWEAAEAKKAAWRQRTTAQLAAGDGSYTQSFLAGVQLQVDAWGTAQQQMSAVGAQLANDLAEGPGNALIEIQHGTKSVGQAFSDMAIGMIEDMEKMLIKMLMMQAIQSTMSYFGGGAGYRTGTDDAVSGGYIPRYRAGSTGQDEVPIIVHPYEKVTVRSQQQAKDEESRGSAQAAPQIVVALFDDPNRMRKQLAANPHWIAATINDNPALFGR